MRMGRILASCFLLSLATTVDALPITYTFTGIGTGTIGSTPFVDTPFAVTVGADTTGKTLIFPPDTFGNDSITASIEIGGTGVFQLTEPTAVGVGNSDAFVTFVYGTVADPDYDLYLLTHPSFTTFDLISDFGPVLVPTPREVTFYINTTGGPLRMFEAHDATFQSALVAPVPEPASGLLLGAGMLAAGFVRRARKMRLPNA